MAAAGARLEVSNSEMPPGALGRRAPRSSNGAVSCPGAYHDLHLRSAPPDRTRVCPLGALAWLLSRCRAACCPVHRASAIWGAWLARPWRLTPVCVTEPHPRVPQRRGPAGARTRPLFVGLRPLCKSPLSRHIRPSLPHYSRHFQTPARPSHLDPLQTLVKKARPPTPLDFSWFLNTAATP